MKTTMTLSLVLMMSFVVGAFAVTPTAGAHACNDGSTEHCDGESCPDDGGIHAHRNNGHSCQAIPSPIQNELADTMASGDPGAGELPAELYPLIDGNELFLGLA